MNMLCQNMYPKYVDLGNGEILPRLEATPGIESITRLADLDGSGIRSLHELNGILYALNGRTLYSVDIDGGTPGNPIIAVIGTIPGSPQVSSADNGTQIMWVDPETGTGYIYNTSTSVFSQITDADFTANGNPQYVIFIDGYFMASTDSNKFIVSALRDGLSWNALDFGSAESDPDPIVGLINFKNEAYIFGSVTCEAFQNIGGSGFPFQRNGLILDKGLVSPLSVVQTTDSFMWIGQGSEEQPAVYALSGTTSVRISNTAIELLLRGLTDSEKQNIFGSSYMQDGSFFICWTLPDVAICYDIYTQKWHTRKSREENNGPSTTWRAARIVSRPNGDIVCGDLTSGRIGKLNREVYTDYLFSNIERIHDARPIRIEKRSFAMPLIEITVESGVGVVKPESARVIDQSAVDPQIRMSISRDAQKFGGERQRPMGKVGQRRQRVRWRRNGHYTDYAQFRFVMTDAVPYTVIRLDAEVRAGRG